MVIMLNTRAVVTIFLFVASAIFSMAYAFQDYDHLGFFGLNTVVYDTHKVAPNKYKLEATTSNGVSKSALIRAYQARAARLCPKEHALINFQISTEMYMGDFNPNMSLPMTAPKINGVVICR